MTARNIRKILWLLIFALPLPILGSFVATNIDSYGPAKFEDMIQGKAHKPFVGRVLVPILVKTAANLVPQAYSNEVDKWAEHRYPRFEGIRFTHLLLSLVIWYFSLIGFSLSLLSLTHVFYDSPDTTTLSIVAAALCGIPIFFRYYSYMYDLPNLFLFTLCLVYLSQSKWVPYIVSFTLATLNKETSILLILIFCFHYRKWLRDSFLLQLLLIQTIIYTLIRVSILVIYKDNPGSVVEFHLGHNLLLAPYSLSQFLSFLAIIILSFHDWAGKPAFIKSSSVIAIPLVLLTIFFGYIDEYRDFYEFYPILILLVSHSIVKHVLRAPLSLRVARPLTTGSSW